MKSNGEKIAIDARMIEMSGIGTYIQHLMGCGIYDVAVGDEKTIRKYDKNVEVIQFTAPIYKLQEQLHFPERELKKKGVDIIHFPHYNVPLSFKGRYAVTLHDLIHIIYPQYLKNYAEAIYAKLLMGHALKHAEKIFTVSECSKKDIEKYFHIDPSKINITYNAVDGDFFREKDRREVVYLLDKFHLPVGKKIILYVGNIKPHKNLSVLLQAYASLPNRDDYVVILVGKSFGTVPIQNMMEENGLSNGVNATGAVTDNELVDLYNLADVFVFPSLYEGFGIPPLEAMSCGTPVICSNASSLPEVVGDSALLFDPLNSKELRDDIEQIFTDAQLKNELKMKGFERAKAFQWERTQNIVKRELSI